MTPEEEIVAAWFDEGNHPRYHRTVRDTLVREWPTLTMAIEKLIQKQIKELGDSK